MMQTEVLPREKMMHDMIERMQAMYLQATQKLHAQMSDHMSRVGAGDENSRKKMLDPLQEMESELARIATLLGHEVVKPDISGWKAPGGSSRPSAPRGVSPIGRSPMNA